MDIQAVDRVGMILALFGPHREAVSSSEAADLIGLNRTTTYRYLTSLANAHVLELREDRTYVPGPTLMQLGAFALGRRSVLTIAQPLMSTLARDTNITTVLSLWGESAPVVAHVEESPQREIVVTVRVGMQLSDAAAQTQVFRAYRRPDTTASRVSREAAHERSSAEEAAREAAATRARGYAGQISARGIAVLAVPVFDPTGMVATLALLSTRDVLDVQESCPELGRLRESAKAISAGLGA